MMQAWKGSSDMGFESTRLCELGRVNMDKSTVRIDRSRDGHLIKALYYVQLG